MLRFMSPIALLALTVSAMPLSPRAEAPIAGATPLEPVRLSSVTAMPLPHATDRLLDSASPVRSISAEQTDVWMSEQGVAMILDAARPLGTTPVALARR